MSREKDGWFQTHTGRAFWPTSPMIEDIDIRDIAHALSMLCRFNGHVKFFYSVADHSVRVSKIVPRSLALTGLLHDASEAYLGDMIRPLKLEMPEYRAAEERLERLIAKRFGLEFPWHPDIKNADLVLLRTERRDLLAHQRPWAEGPQPLAERIVPMDPAAVEAAFFQRYHELIEG